MIRNFDLKEKIVDLSFRYGLSHLGSCLTAVDIIDDIYRTKAPEDKFVLSQGHAGLALYAVLEKMGCEVSAETMLRKCGIHPDRYELDIEDNPIHASTGSLGQGLPIALGMAMADRTKRVYCLISDGEMAEGSIWEALRIMMENEVTNLRIFVNMNGYSALGKTDELFIYDILNQFDLEKNIKIVETDMDEYPEYLQGLKGHYHVLNDMQYQEMMRLLK
jgi:transketolase